MDPLTANLVTVGVPLLVVAVATATILVRGRRRAAGMLSRPESWAISILGAVAMMTVLTSLWGLVGTAGYLFSGDPVRIDGFPFAGITAPELLADVPHLVESGYGSVWMTVSDLPSSSLWLLYLEEALPMVGAICISVVVAWLSFTLVRERPFARAFPVGFAVAAVAIVVAGLGSQFAAAMARSSVIAFLGEEQLTGDTTTTPPHDVFVFLSLQLDLAPIGWAFGLLLVAAAFQIGIRMQKDTEALV
ncbi:hypothetical protein [Microbacterium sp. E-13]|uniref:hypothetical protein n=1 Tax=Microbacterium sp. E-13 TaxID=3404048 RepID=UPI003CEDFB6C